jgi:carbon catabolite-derepressing protein kinase
VLLAVTGKLVAINAFDKEYLKDPYSKNKVTRETYLQRSISHDSVIRLIEVVTNDTHLLIIMEYACNGDLLHYLKNKKRLSKAEARKHFRQIVLWASARSKCVLHRNTKLGNLLLDEDMGVKVCDFGVSRIIGKRQLIKKQRGIPACLPQKS